MSQIKAGDPVAAAIAATGGGAPDQQQATVAMRQWQVGLAPDNRPAILLLPDDLTDQELLELAGWILTGYRQQVKQFVAPTPLSRLTLPGRRQ